MQEDVCAKKKCGILREVEFCSQKNKGEALLLSQQKDKNWNTDPAILIDIS
jgi:hypothetical protein